MLLQLSLHPLSARTYNQLRTIVAEAWESISPDHLDSIVNTIGERCRDVIAAKGGHTKW
ncbi:hypothetical protein PMIN01_06336 [Paraphaeosphaeria minitans]|uniref:Uncharacterized protein n=1 Tax=Paraphaeosphaeria minitans TaxID=565426 RepID=A0A9P6GFV7_9PLEO|nr:hypothetical protein PMIN01_06336 [Paraphaeosphaeria minitans]